LCLAGTPASVATKTVPPAGGSATETKVWKVAPEMPGAGEPCRAIMESGPKAFDQRAVAFDLVTPAKPVVMLPTKAQLPPPKTGSLNEAKVAAVTPGAGSPTRASALKLPPPMIAWRGEKVWGL